MKPRHSSSTSSTNTRSFPSPLCQPSVCWLLLCLQLPAATQPGRGTPTSKQTPWTQQGTAWPPHHLYRPPTGLYALFAALHPRCSLCHLPAGAVSSIILDIHLRRLYFNTEVPSNDVHAELFLSLKTSHWLPCGLSVYKVIKDSNLYKVCSTITGLPSRSFPTVCEQQFWAAVVGSQVFCPALRTMTSTSVPPTSLPPTFKWSSAIYCLIQVHVGYICLVHFSFIMCDISLHYLNFFIFFTF